MSCGCSTLKVNVCEAGLFSFAKLAMIKPGGGKKEESEGTGYKSAKKMKNAVLGDAIVYGISGVIYDDWLAPSWMTGEYADKMILSNQAMKLVYQVAIQQLYDMMMKRKANVKNLLEDIVAAGVAIYGPDILNGVGMPKMAKLRTSGKQ